MTSEKLKTREITFKMSLKVACYPQAIPRDHDENASMSQRASVLAVSAPKYYTRYATAVTLSGVTRP